MIHFTRKWGGVHAFRRIKDWLDDWEARRRAQRYKAMPVMRELDRQEAEYRRSHRRGAARIVRAKRDAMTRALAGATNHNLFNH